MKRLLTNLSYVTVAMPGAERTLRTNCAALLIEPKEEDMLPRPPRLRGFGPDPAWPVFDMALPVEDPFDYVTEPYKTNAILMTDGGPRPIGGGDVLRWPSGHAVYLDAEDTDRAIRAEDFEDDDYDGTWAALTRNAAEFWQAPYMPSLVWGPPHQDVRTRLRNARVPL